MVPFDKQEYFSTNSYVVWKLDSLRLGHIYAKLNSVTIGLGNGLPLLADTKPLPGQILIINWTLSEKNLWTLNWYGSGHEGVAVLLPGFANKW